MQLGRYAGTGDIERFSNQLSAQCSAERNQERLVFWESGEDLSPIELPVEKAWRFIINRITGQASSSHQLVRYSSSLFYRLQAIQDENQLREKVDIVTPLLLKGNARYDLIVDCYAPHLSGEKLSQLELLGESNPPFAVEVRGIYAAQDGPVALKITPQQNGAATVRIRVWPESIRSSQLDLVCLISGAVVEAGSTPPGPRLKQSSDVEGRAIPSEGVFPRIAQHFESLPEITGQMPRIRLAVAQALLESDPNETERRYLLEQIGFGLYQSGNFAQAFETFAALDTERIKSPRNLAAFYISAWQSGRQLDLEPLANRFSARDDPSMTEQMLRNIPWKQVTKKDVDALFYLGLIQKETAGEIIRNQTSGPKVVEWTTELRRMGVLDPGEEYALIERWLRDHEFDDQAERVVEELVEAALRIKRDPAGFVEAFGDRIVQLGRWETVERWLEHCLQDECPNQFREAFLRMLNDRGQPEQRLRLALVHHAVAEHYLHFPTVTVDHMDRVQTALRRSQTLLGDSPETGARLEWQRAKNKNEALWGLWKKAVEQNQEIQKQLDTIETVQGEKLRAILHQKKALIVGGLDRTFQAGAVAHELGFASCEQVELFAESNRDLRRTCQQIRRGAFDYVIDLVAWGPHRNEVKEAAASNPDVHYVPGPRSWSVQSFRRILWDYQSKHQES